MSSKRNFLGIWIPAGLWLDGTISITQKAILLEVQSFTEHNYNCFVSNDHLAKLCTVSASAIEKAIRDLCKRGLLHRKTEYNGTYRQRVLTVHKDVVDSWQHPQQTEVPTRNKLRQHPQPDEATQPQPAEVPTRSQLRNKNTVEEYSNKNTISKDRPHPNSKEEVEEYILHLCDNPHSTATDIYDYYEANGWKQSNGNKIKNWKAAARGWINRQKQYTNERSTNKKGYNAISNADLTEAIRKQAQ
jgi:hypothetical protein